MPVKQEIAPNRTSFSPTAMATFERDWIFHDFKGQHILAFETQAKAVQHQFGLSRKAVESILSNIRPHADQPPDPAVGDMGYFRELGRQIGRESEVDNAFETPADALINWLRERKKSEQKQDVEFNTLLWSEIYGIPADQLQPIMQKRVETFQKLFGVMKSGQPDWVQLQTELVEYYTQLHALVFPTV